MNLAELRLSYTKYGLLESDALIDPIEQFRLWFNQALAAQIPEANAMTLATNGLDGTPNARLVLLKGLDELGLVFYTNYRSRKGVELERDPRATLLFYWPDLERQVRMSGVVTKVPDDESDAYFASRPRGHQLGAWASEQSQVIDARETLEQKEEAVAERFRNSVIPRPPHWGGYRLSPETVEFWQGRPNRLHDRLEYRRISQGWERRRLSP
jgi:pyridoxamine 5'-phosphate oxidase